MGLKMDWVRQCYKNPCAEPLCGGPPSLNRPVPVGSVWFASIYSATRFARRSVRSGSVWFGCGRVLMMVCMMGFPAIALAAVLASASAMAQAPADICVPGYAREHRMPYADSAAIKREILPVGHSVSEYELDHIVPLCMGGSNDRSNLQLQPWDEAKRKDVDEWRLCRAVCAGWISLDDAQRQMREWRP